MDSNFFRPKIIVPKLYLKLEFDTEDQVLFQTFLNFRLIWKMRTPLKYQFQTFLNLRTNWWPKTPRTNLKGLFSHIYIEKGQIKCSNFSFLGWGLRVTYNWDIFEKFRPPWVWKILNLKLVIFLGGGSAYTSFLLLLLQSGKMLYGQMLICHRWSYKSIFKVWGTGGLKI